jgi:undecaprenyl pyrophosphate synthase
MAPHHVEVRFTMAKNNIPRHVGFIPDGNRRWAMDHGMSKEAGYAHGIDPGFLLFEKCKAYGKEYRQRQGVGMKVNLLVNYGWEWDLAGLKNGGLRSDGVSRLDLIVRWGGARRLSGFLPVQSVYADFYVRDEYWPDFHPQHFEDALAWYKNQDQTLGG